MITQIKQKIAEAKKDADTNDFSYGKYIAYKECLALAEDFEKWVKDYDAEACCHGIRQKDIIKELTGEIVK